MSNKAPCPKCGGKLSTKALVDSDQRIWQQWQYCSAVKCGFDARTPMQRSVCTAVGAEDVPQ